MIMYDRSVTLLLAYAGILNDKAKHSCQCRIYFRVVVLSLPENTNNVQFVVAPASNKHLKGNLVFAKKNKKY